MVTKEDFSSDEWQSLKDVLLYCGLLVMVVSPQDAVGMTRESNVLSQAVRIMLQAGSVYPLIQALRLDMTAQRSSRLPLEGTSQDIEMRLRSLVVGRCRQANLILAEKVSESEANFFKRGVLWICARVAMASKEGGNWLGRNAVLVTDEERGAIRQIAFAFGISASESIVEELPDVPPCLLPTKLEGIISPEDWTLLRQAPFWIGASVIAASPSGWIGLVKEMTMLIRALQETGRKYPDNCYISGLLDDMVIQPDLSSINPIQQSMDANVLLQHTVQICHDVVHILDEKADQKEATEFRRMLLMVGQRVAEGSREGGFLGIGGELISKEEIQVLNQISVALGQEDPNL